MLSFARAADDHPVADVPQPTEIDLIPASTVILDDAILLMDESSVSYVSELTQLSNAHASEEESLVIKICTAISMSLPQLPEERMHHAMFNKHMYLDGEITFQRFILKMRNLFPNRMEQLSEDLRVAISRYAGEAH